MAKRIPQNKIDEIYNVVDIVEVVGDFLQMKKRGTTYFALSPWSNEKTPSFAISPSKNIFKDFSTGKGGNAITFLMELEGMTYVEALKYVAEKYNIDLEFEESDEEVVEKDRRESLLILNEFAAKFFHKELMEGDEGKRIGLSYFKERGLLETTLEKFEIGYSPDQWTALVDAASKAQYKEEYLLETGLAFAKENDNQLLDRFKGRVMFPIHDHLGKIIGFGGRVLGDKKAAKYVNSPESPVYHKSRVLYGLYQAKQSIRDKDQVVMVEGYMDVVSLFQNGIHNVVATSGTALTDDQIRLTKRFTKNVILIYDSDPAGVKAALRGADLMLESELDVKVLLLPEGQDPDSFVKDNGKTGFEKFLEENAKDFIAFKIDELLKEKDTKNPADLTEVIHETAETLARIPDPVRQSVFLQFAAQRLNVSDDLMTRSLGQAVANKAKLDQRNERFRQRREERQELRQESSEPSGVDQPLVEKEVVANQEKEILRIMINHFDKTIEIEEEEVGVLGYVLREVSLLEFEHDFLEIVKAEIFSQYEKNQTLDLNLLLTHQDQRINNLVSGLLTVPYEVSENWEKFDIRAPSLDQDLTETVVSAVLHFKLKKIKRLIKESKDKIKEANSEVENEKHILVYAHLLDLRQGLEKEIGIIGGIDANITNL